MSTNPQQPPVDMDHNQNPPPPQQPQEEEISQSSLRAVLEQFATLIGGFTNALISLYQE